MTKINEISKYDQSIWYDNIRRAMLRSGELQNLINQGVTGVTSNPSIFEKAIVGSNDYDTAIRSLVNQGLDQNSIYESLVIEDIRAAADVLLPIYNQTNAKDGYISLEVRPTLSHDTTGTIEEARRLFSTLARPNVMIKVPATPEGMPAIETLISEGININVTLIFSLAQYEDVAKAYINGLKKRVAAGKSIDKIASVASFFVSRVDSMTDAALLKLDRSDLEGKTAIANAKMAYERFLEIFAGAQWDKLEKLGAQKQRPLWASTGTKNPAYSDTLYIHELIGPDTVNTVPPTTLSAFLNHGHADLTLPGGFDAARQHLVELKNAGIDLDQITTALLEDGLTAFVKSFETLMAGIEEKQAQLKSEWSSLSANLGQYQNIVSSALQEIKRDRIIQRIWEHDFTVWKSDPTEISNRLGWLDIADRMQAAIPRMNNLAETLRKEGYQKAVLLGMGGSSLAPEVLRKTFGVKAGYLDLTILDSTDPGTIIHIENLLDLEKTLFIVSTKSGSTPETLSFFKYFYNRVVANVGIDKAGDHFIAITDPGSKLVGIASEYDFRDIFINDPNIGGRYSALSYFGLVPAALLGVDLPKLLDRAITAACNCDGCNCPVDGDNRGGQLGAILGELAKSGRDKITFVLSSEIESFGDWVEQLIAESTGKEGKGILPVVGESLGTPSVYANDRLFVNLRIENDDSHDKMTAELANAGHPIVTLHLKDIYDLGQQFFLWEMATAVAGSRMGINPFDQPNVESAKILTRNKLTAYKEEGKLLEPEPFVIADGIHGYGNFSSSSINAALQEFFGQAQSDSYVAIQAYIQPTPEADELLKALRTIIRNNTRMATTLGYGPRFLHSTGQLHKGDAGKGLFLQLTASMPHDLMIPDEAGKDAASTSFATLKTAQVLGDFQALVNVDRMVIRFDLGNNLSENLMKLGEAI
ncbi:MAG: bifunctional transaldolase/phosoglucose isomerase [Anaerolineaceae bacterium]|nr:bifunctional transaldolase/phosoglucose isomerase [Anaerolineaceae bacterium]